MANEKKPYQKGTFKMTQPVEKKETLQEVMEFPFNSYPERGISVETMKDFGVRSSHNTETGKVDKYYFPSYNQNGVITGYMCYDKTKGKKEKYHWYAVGTVDNPNKLFGQNVAENASQKRKKLYITEGQWDCMSVYQALKNADGAYADYIPPVVSIPLGTKSATACLMQNLSFLESYQEDVVLFFDNDEATEEEAKKGVEKGKEASTTILINFSDKLKIKTVKHREGLKDASDYLQAGVNKTVFSSLEKAQEELKKTTLFNNIEIPVNSVIDIKDLSFEELTADLKKDVDITIFPKLNEMLYGLRGGEVTLFTAESGVGKSTTANKIANLSDSQGYLAGFMNLEEEVQKTARRAMADYLGLTLREYMTKKNELRTPEEIKEAYEVVTSSGKKMLKHFGSIEMSELLKYIKYLHFVEKRKLIVLDHLSLVVSGRDIDERKELDMIMTELASFVSGRDLHIIVVVHLNRSVDTKPPKGSEGKDYWVRINTSNLRGSSGLEQMSWNIIAIERQVKEDRTRGLSRFVVLKNREGDQLGEADTFQLNNESGKVELYEKNGTGDYVLIESVGTLEDDGEPELPF